MLTNTRNSKNDTFRKMVQQVVRTLQSSLKKTMDVWLNGSGKLVSNWYKTRVCVNVCVRLCDDKTKTANNAINF